MVAPAESPPPFRRRRLSPHRPRDWWVTDLPCPAPVEVKLKRPVDRVHFRKLLAPSRARLQDATGLDARELQELRSAVLAAGLCHTRTRLTHPSETEISGSQAFSRLPKLLCLQALLA